MPTFSAVDLSRLPAPSAVEVIDYEVLLGQWLDLYRERDPSYSAIVESDPVYKLAEVGAYREMLLRQRVNEGIKSVLLAYAADSMLDHLGAFFGVERRVVTEANPALGTTAVMEPDVEFRRRIQMAPEGFSVAGPAGAYISHALAADPRVLDASADSPLPGHVLVYVLSREGDGTAPDDLLANVATAVNHVDVRPLTDFVTVLSAAVIEYEVEAVLEIYPGPDPAVVLQAAQDAVAAYTDDNSRMARKVSRSALDRALHQEGVVDVTLVSPAENVAVGVGEASRCTGIRITTRTVSDV
ncbi:baseplate assembly protein [Stenotrophomonas lactitubi]|uniref:baseplate assembly protein n=1 Tax=Stenotrophomonas lactitubi TaxID=2045214 RepID=UPI0020420633|nr:baseplate J/gp47 family protein [Stenotrophomonas lactitubi]